MKLQGDPFPSGVAAAENRVCAPLMSPSGISVSRRKGSVLTIPHVNIDLWNVSMS